MSAGRRHRWSRSSRFDETPEDPQASLVNLVDIMLVFICALIVALVSAQPQMFSTAKQEDKQGSPKQVVQQGREIIRHLLVSDWRVRAGGLALLAAVHGNDFVLALEERDLRRESADAAAIAVDQEQRFAFAIDLVVELRAIMLKGS